MVSSFTAVSATVTTAVAAAVASFATFGTRRNVRIKIENSKFYKIDLLGPEEECPTV